MGSRDTLETDTRVVDAPDVPREIPETERATESPRGQVLDDPESGEKQVFRRQLREALSDPSRLPGDELPESVQYDEWSDEEFLHRLWRDLYGDETP
jgi:hypothetical protein